MKKLSQLITSAAVAEQLGLSRATVSYVLNGQAEKKKISGKTTRRVMEAAERLGYVPNELARSLRMQQSGVIGLVTRGLGYNWIERILVGMLPVFDREGYAPFLATSYWDAQRERMELNTLLQRRVDGIICMPMPYNQDLYRQIIQRNIPLVFLGDTIDDLMDVNYVVWDAAQATRTALEHLIRSGRRRIGFIGADHQTHWTNERFRVYREVLHEHGMMINDKWVAWELFDFSYHVSQRIETMVGKVLPSDGERPDALYVSSDALAIKILDILNVRGVRVPDDLAIIGLGDYFMSDHSGIGLTTVREPTEELGAQAAEAVFQLIKDNNKTKIQKVLVSNELFVRKTA